MSGKASAESMTPSTSKVKELQNTDPFDEVINLEMGMERPLAFTANPNDVVPHDQIEARIRKSIVDTYGEEYFLGREWTRLQLRRLWKAITHPRENFSNAIAQVCGPACRMSDTCPFDAAGRRPIGDRCPIEIKYAKYSYDQYVLAVSERLNISSQDVRENIIIHNLINGLVESDMIDMRMNHAIANDGFEDEVPVAFDPESGTMYSRKDESVPVRIKERVSRRKDQLFRQLLATPEMAERYKKKSDSDLLARQAKAVEQLENLAKSLIDAQNLPKEE